jgi:hypothetical protein
MGGVRPLLRVIMPVAVWRRNFLSAATPVESSYCSITASMVGSEAVAAASGCVFQPAFSISGAGLR